MITAAIFLDPIAALWTLLHLLTLNKLDERLVRSRGVSRNLILLAGLAFVILASAVQAVVLPAHGASEVSVGLCFEDEGVLAICGRAPRHIFFVPVHCKLQAMPIVLLKILSLEVPPEVLRGDLSATLRGAAGNGAPLVCYLSFEVVAEAFSVEDVHAIPEEVCVFVSIGIETDPAFELLLLFPRH